MWEQCLYVGTQCGLVIYYFLEEHKTPLGKAIFQSRVKGRIQLGAEKVWAATCAYLNSKYLKLLQRKAVQQISVLPNHKKLLALVDGK